MVLSPDDRQKYYVYLPNNVTANSPVVVMIPGGGWFSGQDVNVLGFPFNWGGSSSVSIVKDLLDNGYVVVSMVYRLVQLGNNQSEFTSNPIGWQNQIDDITLAINHIRANFSTCLWGTSLNANNIHILGESAGGHLALMYAYTHPNQTYIHSVISMYAPTNLQTMGQWIKTPPILFICGGLYLSFISQQVSDCGSHTRLSNWHFPFYWAVDYNLYNSEQNYFYNNCQISNNSLNPEGNISDNHIYPGINLFQSSVKHSITNPSTDFDLDLYSPRFRPAVGCYPTFIMHGREDIVVPYDNSTTGMQQALNSPGGGVVFTDNVINTTPMPTTYTTPHLIRKYCKADHGWYSVNNTDRTILRNKIRQDVITWLINH